MAKEAAKGEYLLPLISTLDLFKFQPEYSISDQNRAEEWKFKDINNGWKINEQGVVLPPERLREAYVLEHIHKATHMEEIPRLPTSNPGSQVQELLRQFVKS